MIETTITSGRMNPGVDPVLHAWGWEIPVYLFIGGLVAGILFFSAMYFLRGRQEDYCMTVKVAPMYTPILLAAGLFALFLDLSHKLYFWKLYTTIRWESPMSWGAWTLMLIFPLSILWSVTWINDVFPGWTCRWKRAALFIEYLKTKRKPMAWANLVLAVVLGMYTGILLSAFNARPFWNTSILGPLFLVSGLSTGAAFILLMSRSKEERLRFTQIDGMLIAIEIFLIIHLFMGFLASTSVHIEAAELFLGGPYTAAFWSFVVILGLAVPLLAEMLELKGYTIPHRVPAFLVLMGGFILRFIIVDAGQTSRWLYKFME